MASKYFKQFVFSAIPNLTYIEGSLLIGATGAVTSYIGSYVSSVTRSYVGTYRIAVSGTYNRLEGAWFDGIAGVTGNSVAITALATNTTYQVLTVGNSDWTAVTGWPSGVTAAIGVTFVAGGTGTGSGTAKAVGACGWDNCQLMGNPNKMLNPSTGNALINFQTVLAATVADPTNGSSIRFGLWLKNSSVVLPGELSTNF